MLVDGALREVELVKASLRNKRKDLNMDNKNNEPMIYKNKALKDLRGVKDVLVGLGDPFLANMLNRAIECIERQKTVENAEVVVHC